MSYKNEKHTYIYSVQKGKENCFYLVVRDYIPMEDISRIEENERITYQMRVKNKNLVRFFRDINVMKICGLDIQNERS